MTFTLFNRAWLNIFSRDRRFITMHDLQLNRVIMGTRLWHVFIPYQVSLTYQYPTSVKNETDVYAIWSVETEKYDWYIKGIHVYEDFAKNLIGKIHCRVVYEPNSETVNFKKWYGSVSNSYHFQTTDMVRCVRISFTCKTDAVRFRLLLS